MTIDAFEIATSAGKNIIYAYSLRTISLHKYTGTNMPEFNQVHDVVALSN
jgi:hypothetical protein